MLETVSPWKATYRGGTCLVVYCKRVSCSVRITGVSARGSIVIGPLPLVTVGVSCLQEAPQPPSPTKSKALNSVLGKETEVPCDCQIDNLQVTVLTAIFVITYLQQGLPILGNRSETCKCSSYYLLHPLQTSAKTFGSNTALL